MQDMTRAGREAFRLLYPPHTPPRAAPLPDTEFFRTLQIDQMVSVRRESWRGLPDLRLEQFFTTDPINIPYAIFTTHSGNTISSQHRTKLKVFICQLLLLRV